MEKSAQSTIRRPVASTVKPDAGAGRRAEHGLPGAIRRPTVSAVKPDAGAGSRAGYSPPGV